MRSSSSSISVPEQQEPSEAGLGLWDRVSFGFVHGLAAALLRVLSIRGFFAFGRFFGTLEWAVNHRRRRRFSTALEALLGRPPSRQERRYETLEYFRQSRCDRLFYLVFDCVTKEQAGHLLTITNRSLLDAAAARGRGVYVALAHQGAVHVVGMLMSMHGYRVAGVRDRNEGALRRYVQRRFDEKYPEFVRARVLFADSYPRDIYRTLEEGYILGSTLDFGRVRDPHQRIEEFMLGGQRRYFPTGPMRIALRCGSPVLQGFFIPGKGFHYTLEITEMLIDPDQVDDESEAVRKAMERYVANLDAHMRSRPSLMTRI